MAAQRNNITELPPELRQMASKLIYDAAGRHYDRVRQAMSQAGCTTRLHNSTLKSWQRSDEYRRYRDAREAVENQKIRAIAQAINDGEGPRDYADVAVFEVVRALAERMQAGEISELGDLGAVTKALAPLLRAKIAADATGLRRQIAELRAELKRLATEHTTSLSERDARIAELSAAAAAAGVDLDSERRTEDGLSPAALAKIEDKAKLL